MSTSRAAAARREPLVGDGTTASPRVAPDAARAAVILDAWAKDEDVTDALARGERFRAESLEYADGDQHFFGRLVWTEGGSLLPETRPGVLLVHTAVGPHDLMLHWRAESLASLGFAVLIVDLFGDFAGDGWEQDWSKQARHAFQEDRPLLLRRMELSLAALGTFPLVNSSRIAALGYCFGGPAVLDLARANPNGLCAAVTFHGILDANPPPPGVEGMRSRVLLCHAHEDPFVSPEVFAACTSQLRELGANWSALVFGGGALHSFTNPAQALNPAPQFGYDERAARDSWRATKVLLTETLTEKPQEVR